MMKQIVGKTILTIALVSVLCMRCDSDDSNSTKETGYLKRLSGSWHIARVTLEGTDVSHLFEDLVLTINTDRTYSVVNGIPPIWPYGGSFSLAEASQPGQYHMVRQDGMEILVSELSDESLRVNFSYHATASGRVSSVSGGYDFLFERQ